MWYSSEKQLWYVCGPDMDDIDLYFSDGTEFSEYSVACIEYMRRRDAMNQTLYNLMYALRYDTDENKAEN